MVLAKFREFLALMVKCNSPLLCEFFKQRNLLLLLTDDLVLCLNDVGLCLINCCAVSMLKLFLETEININQVNCCLLVFAAGQLPSFLFNGPCRVHSSFVIQLGRFQPCQTLCRTSQRSQSHMHPIKT